jgi:hypothetical protein
LSGDDVDDVPWGMPMVWDPEQDPVPFRAEESVKWRLSRVQEGLSQLTMELADQEREQRAQLRRLGILTGGLAALREVNDRIVAERVGDDWADAARYALTAGQVVTRDRFNESMRRWMEPDPAVLDHLAEYRARVQEVTDRWLHPQGGHAVLPSGQGDGQTMSDWDTAMSYGWSAVDARAAGLRPPSSLFASGFLDPDTFRALMADQDTDNGQPEGRVDTSGFRDVYGRQLDMVQTGEHMWVERELLDQDTGSVIWPPSNRDGSGLGGALRAETVREILRPRVPGQDIAPDVRGGHM